MNSNVLPLLLATMQCNEMLSLIPSLDGEFPFDSIDSKLLVVL